MFFIYVPLLSVNTVCKSITFCNINGYKVRTIIYLLAFLSSLCSYSQVKDDFTDGDFTNNPVWSGEVDRFKIDKKGQLKLNDVDKLGDAYLSTPSLLVRNTTWSFYVHLYFNPSANNYAMFFLTSSSPDLSGILDGYLLLIGGLNDNLSLLRNTGERADYLIEGMKGRLGASSPEVRVKVHCDNDGKWMLYSQVIGVDDDFVEEGTAIDTSISTSSYVGVRCFYTSSRNTSFAFDDILITSDSNIPDEPDEPTNPDEPDIPNPSDTTAPKLLSAFAATDSTVQLFFDEDIKVSNAVFHLNGGGGEQRRLLLADKKSVILVFTNKFVDGQTYSLQVGKVKDVAGNYMSDTWINFTYYDGTLQSVDFGDVVFSEIMANPVGVASLPEMEYIELHNNTERPVNLNTWKFHYGNKSYKLAEAIVPPEGYLVLCHEKGQSLWKDMGVSVSGVKSFPELANSGKLLWLEDARGKMISWVEYSDTWYKDNFKKKGGFSLECLDMSNMTNDQGNWAASADASGGTPGQNNSVKAEYPDETVSEVDYSYFLSSDTLVICFNKPMDLISLATKDNYTVTSGSVSIAKAIPSTPGGRNVKIALSDSLRTDEILELELLRLKDISGFDLQGSRDIREGIPQDAALGEVLFNEVLFNPVSGGSDYVELYNDSEKYINLHHLFFASRSDNGGLSEGILLSSIPRTLAPHGYLCFTENIASVKHRYECMDACLFAIGDLPSLPDDKGDIVLLSPSGEAIDEFRYSEKMHTALLNDAEGISLEKIHPGKLSGISANWLSASSASGGGTPGYVNSQYRDLSESSSEEFWLEKQYFTPDGDGADDELVISYNFPEEEAQANIQVYDASGRLVCKIADNFRLEPEGIFIWNGQESDGSPARIGLYIIYIEAYAPSGKMKRYKLGCALTR